MKKTIIILAFSMLVFAMGMRGAQASTASDLQASITNLQQVVETASVPVNYLLQPPGSWLEDIQQAAVVALRQNHLQEYSDDYYAARGYQDNTLQAVDIAQKFLNEGDLMDATKYLNEAVQMEQAWHLYDDAALDVWQGNISQAQVIIQSADQTLNSGICLTAQVAAQSGIPASPVGIIGKAICDGAQVLNYAVDYDYTGVSAVVKNAIIDTAVTATTKATTQALKDGGISAGGIVDVEATTIGLGINLGALANTIDMDSSPSQTTTQLISQMLQADNQTSADIKNQFDQFTGDLSSLSVPSNMHPSTASTNQKNQSGQSGATPQASGSQNNPPSAGTGQTTAADSGSQQVVCILAPSVGVFGPNSSGQVPIGDAALTNKITALDQGDIVKFVGETFNIANPLDTATKSTNAIKVELSNGQEGWIVDYGTDISDLADVISSDNAQATCRAMISSTQTDNSATAQPTTCTPNWQCNSWSYCYSNQQSRLCGDSNNCGVTAGEPITTQSCTPQY